MLFEKSKFKAAVDAVTPFSAKISPLQILQYVKIESDGNRVTFTAARGDAQIQYWVDCRGESFGICIEAQALRKFVQFCDGDVTFTVKGKKASMEFGDTKTRLNVLDADEFPVMVQSEDVITEIEWAPIADKIAAVEPFCGVNASMPQVSCVQLNSTGTVIEVFGTDGVSMAFEQVQHIAPTFGLCIPRDTARQMVGDFKTLVVREQQVELRSDNAIALFKTSPYKPLPARKIIDRQLPNTGLVTRKSLLEAISFVGSFSDGGKIRPVVRIESGETNAVRLISKLNEAAAPFDYAGDPFQFGAYPDDFAAFLKALPDSDLKIEFDKDDLVRAPIRLTSGNRVICTAPVKV